jgi:hypothetical protein
MSLVASLDKLVQQGVLWRGRDGVADARRCLSTGWRDLDELTGGGWPRGALTELLLEGEAGLGVLLPALARLSRGAGWLVWVNPPYIPYAPALRGHGVCLTRNLIARTSMAQTLWTTEQALRSGACSAVLAWAQAVRPAQVRRLQLAVETSGGLGWLFRPAADAVQVSPAALRLSVMPQAGTLRLAVRKRPAGWGGGEVRIRP